SIGPSMLPTFNIAGDFVVVEHISQRYRKLQLGDVVVCTSPLNPQRQVCKRVLGLPGDRVYVDPTIPGSKLVTIPQGHIWLQGDNYNNSTDSRKYGPVPMGLLRGRVLCKVRCDRSIDQ
ncbi:peptidase S24/S26A/S26B/S26C, partial [Powellomyces hirtus]